MAKQKKKKKRRGFRLFVKIQLVLIVLVLAGSVEFSQDWHFIFLAAMQKKSVI